MAGDSDTLNLSHGNPNKTLESTGAPSTKLDSAAAEGLSKTKTPVSDAERKIRRAKRFGINVKLSEQEKRTSRAERFGTGSLPHGSEVLKLSEGLKRKARAERFRIPVPIDEDAKKKARLERFALASKTEALEDNKRKARAVRFSQASVSSLSVNVKGTIEVKAAIAVKAGGGS